jgi:hypothetical protein
LKRDIILLFIGAVVSFVFGTVPTVVIAISQGRQARRDRADAKEEQRKLGEQLHEMKKIILYLKDKADAAEIARLESSGTHVTDIDKKQIAMVSTSVLVELAPLTASFILPGVIIQDNASWREEPELPNSTFTPGWTKDNRGKP